MESIFRDYILVFMVVYLDMLLIYSDSHEENFDHLEIILSYLNDNELFVGKC